MDSDIEQVQTVLGWCVRANKISDCESSEAEMNIHKGRRETLCQDKLTSFGYYSLVANYNMLISHLVN